jgi:hypothetical protein
MRERERELEREREGELDRERKGELALKWKGEVIGVCVEERVSSGGSGGDGVRKGLLRGGPRGAIPSIIELSSGIIKSPGTG